jgi:phosphoglycolate phosphatase-like HAD superfamily hydrolase
MFLRKLCGGLAGLLALSTFSSGAYAQANFSNASGFQTSGAHGYTTSATRGGVGKFSDSIIARATQLNQTLTAAQQALVDAEYRASSKYNQIQRYSRQPGSGKDGASATDPNCPPSAEALAELERAKANLAQATSEASSFMQTVQNPGAEQINKISSCVNCGSGW